MINSGYTVTSIRFLTAGAGLTICIVASDSTRTILSLCRDIPLSFLNHFELMSYLRNIVSHLIRKTSLTIPGSQDQIRRIFSSTPISKERQNKLNPTHTHAISADSRTRTVNLMRRVSALCGYEPFMFESSRSDERKGLDRSRNYYWSKDMQFEPRSLKVGDKHMLMLVDIDYYMGEEFETFLLNTGIPTMIYTITPESAGYSDKEINYVFNSNNEIEWEVSGGSKYVHRLFDYSGDTLTVVSPILKRNKYGSITYLIDRRKVGPNKSLIMLTPIAIHNKWASLFTRFLDRNSVKHLNVVDGMFARLKVQTPKGMFVSTSRLGSVNSVTMPMKYDDAISDLTSITTNKLQMASVERYIDSENTNDVKAQAAITVHYHRQKQAKFNPPTIFVTSILNYQVTDGKRYVEDARPSMKEFMPAIIYGATAPDLTLENEKHSVKSRITDLKATDDGVLTDFMVVVVKELNELLIPKENERSPVDHSEVFRRQNRPSQTRILETASEGAMASGVINSFIKKETYGKIADPRTISTIDGPTKLEYSRYCYVLSDIIKEQPFYAFGTTPNVIADRVTEICESAQSVLPSDFSRMDGRINYACRSAEEMLYMRAFRREHHSEMLELMNNQYDCRGFTTSGFAYDSGPARASGSPETSLNNTYINVLIVFTAFRMTINPVTRQFYTKNEAFSKLGIYGGDDGLTADLDVERLIKAGQLWGAKITGSPIKRDEPGVNFLARYYGPDVWYGDNNSMCDLKRQLLKFHTTVNMPANVTAKDKLVEKSMAFDLTDHDTPVLGALVQRVIELSPIKLREANSDTGKVNWFAQYSKDVQFPNEVSNWADEFCTEQLPDFDHETFNNHLKSSKTLEELMIFPCCSEITKVELNNKPSVVNGEICEGTAPVAKKRTMKKKNDKMNKEKNTKGRRRPNVGRSSSKEDRPHQ